MSKRAKKIFDKKSQRSKNVGGFEADGQDERSEILTEEETDEEEALDVEIQLMQTELDELECETDYLQQEEHYLLEKKSVLEAKNVQTGKEMGTIRQDLDFIHGQVPAEAEWIPKEQVVAEFQSFRSLVDQTISRVHSWFCALQGSVLSSSAAKRARRDFALKGHDARQFVQAAVQRHASLHTITAVLLRHYLSDPIARFVFRPLLLEERGKATEALQTIYLQVRDCEPQSFGGRWKAQTYRAAQQSQSETQTSLAKLSYDFVCNLATLYNWSTSSELSRELQEDGYHLALKVFNAAMNLKERVLLYCVEVHAIPYMVRSQEDIRLDAQELYKGKSPSSDHLLGLDVGLVFSTVTSDGGRSKAKWRVQVPATFIGENSHLIAL